MSTYGKKALIYWNYEEKKAGEELQRFDRTPHDLQEEILKKWYPIGMEFEKTSAFQRLKGGNEYYGRYTIVKYVKMLYGWRVDLLDEGGYTHNSVHPGNLRPVKEWIRDEKLNKLGI